MTAIRRAGRRCRLFWMAGVALGLASCLAACAPEGRATAAETTVAHGPFTLVATPRRISSGTFPNQGGNPFATVEVTDFTVRWRGEPLKVPPGIDHFSLRMAPRQVGTGRQYQCRESLQSQSMLLRIIPQALEIAQENLAGLFRALPHRSQAFSNHEGMLMNILSSFRKLALGGLLGASLLTGGAANAAATLTSFAITEGYGLSTFASDFPTTGFCCGPLGIAFVDGGGVMVSDYPGNVRIFATDIDGQVAPSAPVTQFFGNSNAVGLARSGAFVYMTQQGTGNVVRLNQNGTFNSIVVTGMSFPTGITVNPVTGMLYVSDNSGIWAVDPVANSRVLKIGGGFFDGLSVSANGAVVYGELAGHIFGYNLTTGLQVFDSGFFAGADGTELGAGALAGEIFINTNGGELWEVSLSDPLGDRHLLVSGGSRGDFVTADPNGTLLFTQTDLILRLTAPAGGCIGAACGGNVPEPGSLLLVGLGLLGLSMRRKSSMGHAEH